MLVPMSHTLCRAVFHVVFSTKERRNLLPPSLDRTWTYIAGIGRNHDLLVYAVGGTQNHLHALIELRPDMALSNAVGALKSNSSRWLRESIPAFRWQSGYGAFSVSPSQLAKVVNYIRNQEVHHRRMSFDAEMESMLRAAAMHPRASGKLPPLTLLEGL